MWKWIAALLATAIIAGAPAYTTLLVTVARSPTKDDLTALSDRQQTILQRLSAIDVELSIASGDRSAVHDEIAKLRDLISNMTKG